MERLKTLCNGYGDSHRILAQLLIKEKLVPEQCLGQIFLEICKINSNIEINYLKPAQNEEVVNILKKNMNAILSLVGARMVVVSDELRRNTNYFSLVSDRNYLPSLSLVNGLSPDELAVFRFWLGMMFDSDQNLIINGEEHIGELSLHKATYCNSGMSRNMMIKLMYKLHKKRVIVLDEKRSVIRLHTFSIAELATCIQAEYDLPTCNLCQDVIILRRLSEQCICGKHFHVRCLLKHIRDKNQAKCPVDKCQQNFTRELLDRYEFEEDIAPLLPVCTLKRRKRKAANQVLNETPKRRSVSDSIVLSPQQDFGSIEGPASISDTSILSSDETRSQERESITFQAAPSENISIESAANYSHDGMEQSVDNDEMLDQLKIEGWSVAGCYGLFPAVERMAETSSGRKVAPLIQFVNKHHQLTQWLVYCLRSLPNNLKRWIIRKLVGQRAPKCVVDATVELLDPLVIANIAYMAKNELETVKSFDENLIHAANNHLIQLFYGIDDGWSPLKWTDAMRTRLQPEGRLLVDGEGCEHAFVLNHSQVMARQLAELVVGHLSNKNLNY